MTVSGGLIHFPRVEQKRGHKKETTMVMLRRRRRRRRGGGSRAECRRSAVLLTVNALLAELSDRVFAGKGLQDFFSG
ncbi:hypothetical protein Droror1_Dr00019037 [Drosera rotundifolia]